MAVAAPAESHRHAGLTLKVARIERGFTCDQVAAKCGITPRRQQQLETMASLAPVAEDRFWCAIAELEAERAS